MSEGLRNVLEQIRKSWLLKIVLIISTTLMFRFQTDPDVHRIVALDAKSGAVVWRAALSGERESWLFGPVIASGTIMAVSHDIWNTWRLETFEMTTGKPLWTKLLEPWGIPDVLSVKGITVIGLESGEMKRLVAVQTRDGHEIWSQTVQRRSVLLESDGNILTTRSEMNQVFLEERRMTDGKVLHSFNFMQGDLWDIGAVEVANKVFYFSRKSSLCNFKIEMPKVTCLSTDSNIENFSLSNTTIVHNGKSVFGFQNGKTTWKLVDSRDTYLYISESNLFSNKIYLTTRNVAKTFQIYCVEKTKGTKNLFYTFNLANAPLELLISDNRSSLFVTVKDNLFSISRDGKEQWRHYIGGIGGSLTATDQLVFGYEQTSRIQNAFTELLPFLAW